MKSGLVIFSEEYAQGFNCKPAGQNPKIMVFVDDPLRLDASLIQ